MGSALRETGNFREAINYYKRAIALNPSYTDAYYNLALVLQDKDRLDEALDYCQRVVSLKPEFVDGHYSQGFILRRLGRLQEAIACYERAIQREPNYPEAHKNLGHALLLSGDLRRGLQNTSGVGDKSTGHPVPTYNHCGTAPHSMEKQSCCMLNRALGIRFSSFATPL